MEEKRVRSKALKEPFVEIVRENPGYGYQRIKPHLEGAIEEVVNHQRLRRLLNEFDPSLHPASRSLGLTLISLEA